MNTTIDTLIEQYNIAKTDTAKQSIKNQIHLQYYNTSATERAAILEIMKPFLDEIEQEMVQKDPIARQTHEMLTRLEALRTTVGH
jgi:hypothetical protein